MSEIAAWSGGPSLHLVRMTLIRLPTVSFILSNYHIFNRAIIELALLERYKWHFGPLPLKLLILFKYVIVKTLLLFYKTDFTAILKFKSAILFSIWMTHRFPILYRPKCDSVLAITRIMSVNVLFASFEYHLNTSPYNSYYTTGLKRQWAGRWWICQTVKYAK